MTPSFSTFSNSLLFNYWKSDRDSILNDFLRETIPFIFSENTGYAAYSATTYNEEDIVKEIKSITFKEHPHFKSIYTNVSFSLLLKMHNDKCIGHYGAQVSFSYKSVTNLNISLKDLKDCYLSFPNTQIVSLVDNIIEISKSEDKNWPSSVYLKTATKTYDEHLLIFGATDLFF